MASAPVGETDCPNSLGPSFWALTTAPKGYRLSGPVPASRRAPPSRIREGLSRDVHSCRPGPFPSRRWPAVVGLKRGESRFGMLLWLPALTAFGSGRSLPASSRR